MRRKTPSRRACSLARPRTAGLLTSDSVGRFGIPVLLVAEDAFGADGMPVLLCDARGDAVREQRYVRTLPARRVDGLIMVGESTDPRPSIPRGLPVPVVYAYAPSEDPQDVSFVPDAVGDVGYDNWEVLSTETRPPLTTVDMNLEVLGRTAAQYLFAAIDGRAASGVHRMPCTLTIRHSTVRA